MEKGKQKGTLGKVLRYIKRYWFYLALSLIFAAVTVTLTLYLPILIGRAVDMIVKAGEVDFDGIWKLLVQMGIMIGGKIVRDLIGR